MHTTISLLCLFVAVAAALPARNDRIVGGTVTRIENFPSMASLLFSWEWNTYGQNCGGAVITSTAILTAAHCTYNDEAARWRVRVGSTFANSGGTVHRVTRCLYVPTYNIHTLDNDVGLMRLATVIVFSAFLQPAPIAGPLYEVEGNQLVFAAGWGAMSYGGAASEQLRQVQLWTIGLDECNELYGEVGVTVSPNMICVGLRGRGTRDQCTGDSGSPLFHHGTIVGVSSWGHYCAHPFRPGVNAMISKSSVWIQNHVY